MPDTSRPGLTIPIMTQNRKAVLSCMEVKAKDNCVFGVNILGRETLLGVYPDEQTAQVIVGEIIQCWEHGGVYRMPGKDSRMPDSYISEDLPSVRPVQVLLGSLQTFNKKSANAGRSE